MCIRDRDKASDSVSMPVPGTSAWYPSNLIKDAGKYQPEKQSRQNDTACLSSPFLQKK